MLCMICIILQQMTENIFFEVGLYLSFTALRPPKAMILSESMLQQQTKQGLRVRLFSKLFHGNDHHK